MLEGSLLKNKHTGFIRQNKSFLLALVKVVDILIIVLLYFAYLDADDGIIDKQKLIILLFSVLSFEFFATINSLYGIARGARFLFIIKNIITAWLGSVFITLVFSSFSNIIDHSDRIPLFNWLFITTPILLIAWHLLLRLMLAALRKIGINSKIVAIAGATNLGLDMANMITKQIWMGYSLIGFFDDREEGNEDRLMDVDLIGDFDKLLEMSKNKELDIIFITLPMRAEKRIKSLLDELSDSSVIVYYIPNFFVFDLLGSKVENYNGIPALCVYDTPYSGIDGFSKRLLDIVFSTIILTIIAIPLILISIGVKISSPGPILFIQRRYGFRGEEIKVLKFRTMRVCEDGHIVKQATQNDPRITKFGQFLRRTSLDELPQFINVLQGTMSVVGPRPHAVIHNEFYRGQIRGYMLRHNVKPGITGLAQVRGFRGETETLDKMEGRIRADLEYIQNWSVWMDIEIIIKTIFKGFSDKNAY